MIVYYDIVADKEVASDAFDANPVAGYKGVREIQSKKIVFKEVEADIGANASKGDGESGDVTVLMRVPRLLRLRV